MFVEGINPERPLRALFERGETADVYVNAVRFGGHDTLSMANWDAQFAFFLGASGPSQTARNPTKRDNGRHVPPTCLAIVTLT